MCIRDSVYPKNKIRTVAFAEKNIYGTKYFSTIKKIQERNKYRRLLKACIGLAKERQLCRRVVSDVVHGKKTCEIRWNVHVTTTKTTLLLSDHLDK